MKQMRHSMHFFYHRSLSHHIPVATLGGLFLLAALLSLCSIQQQEQELLLLLLLQSSPFAIIAADGSILLPLPRRYAVGRSGQTQKWISDDNDRDGGGGMIRLASSCLLTMRRSSHNNNNNNYDNNSLSHGLSSRHRRPIRYAYSERRILSLIAEPCEVRRLTRHRTKERKIGWRRLHLHCTPSSTLVVQRQTLLSTAHETLRTLPHNNVVCRPEEELGVCFISNKNTSTPPTPAITMMIPSGSTITCTATTATTENRHSNGNGSRSAIRHSASHSSLLSSSSPSTSLSPQPSTTTASRLVSPSSISASSSDADADFHASDNHESEHHVTTVDETSDIERKKTRKQRTPVAQLSVGGGGTPTAALKQSEVHKSKDGETSHPESSRSDLLLPPPPEKQTAKSKSRSSNDGRVSAQDSSSFPYLLEFYGRECPHCKSQRST